MKSDLTKKPQRTLFPVWGGCEVRCPNGHNNVRLSSGEDAHGVYLHTWCTAPGCKAEQVVRSSAR
jgi:hypothetical protein